MEHKFARLQIIPIAPHMITAEWKRREVTKLLSVCINLVYHVSISPLILHYDYVGFSLFVFAIRRLETAGNSAESMHLNITVLRVKAKSEMAGNPLS